MKPPSQEWRESQKLFNTETQRGKGVRLKNESSRSAHRSGSGEVADHSVVRSLRKNNDRANTNYEKLA